MRQIETFIFTLVLSFTIVWGTVAFSALNDGRIDTVVRQLVR